MRLERRYFASILSVSLYQLKDLFTAIMIPLKAKTVNIAAFFSRTDMQYMHAAAPILFTPKRLVKLKIS